MINSPVRKSAFFLTGVLFLAACTGPPADAERDEKVVFRDRVMAILRTEFPDKHFTTTDDPEIILLGEAQFGLQNLRARFIVAGKPDDELPAMVKHHFSVGLAAVGSSNTSAVDWNSAKPLLRPQLMPAEYLDRIPLVHKPFAKAAVQGFVLDRAGTYQHVVVEDLARWKITLEEASQVAEANLQEASHDIPVSSSAGPDKFLAIETEDGYDAARLLLPKIRLFAVEHLGSPFYAAVPNRDFLIMWSKSASPKFQAHARSKVAEDFRQEPYPISGSIFEVTPTTIKEIGSVAPLQGIPPALTKKRSRPESR